MTERPILFSGAMVRAILDGEKTQTRRVVKPTMTTPRIPPLHMELWIGVDGEQEVDESGLPCWLGFHPDYPGDAKWFSCPYGQAGDRLWVRETLRRATDGTWYYAADDAPLLVRERDAAQAAAWAHHKEGDVCSSIYMPRWASRITLEIVAVRVQRVQDISIGDAMDEGVGFPKYSQFEKGSHLVGAFRDLWDSINAKSGYGWAVNPWVWAITFRRAA